jgi:hypothetical protein
MQNMPCVHHWGGVPPTELGFEEDFGHWPEAEIISGVAVFA